MGRRFTIPTTRLTAPPTARPHALQRALVVMGVAAALSPATAEPERRSPPGAVQAMDVAAPSGQTPPAEPARGGFGFCAAPFAPPCIDRRGQTPAQIKICEGETERYVASVFAYRGCLAVETERAVREANGAIQKMRCARNKASCAPPAEATGDAPPGRKKPGAPQRR